MGLADYHPIAREYAEAFHDELDRKPFDCARLAEFAQLGVGSGGRLALDAGCGPRHATALLAEAGLGVEGVDLSPGMVRLAQEQHPQQRFTVADMAALPYGNAAFDGVCAWYSIIHIPADELVALFE